MSRQQFHFNCVERYVARDELCTKLFNAIIPTLFFCFLLICYPYILLHFYCFLVLYHMQYSE